MIRLLKISTIILASLCACSDEAEERKRVTGGDGGEFGGEAIEIQQSEGESRAYIPAREQCFGIINGAVTSLQPSVVLLGLLDTAQESITSRCTGTFVSSTTVITAAHCIDKREGGGVVALIDDCSSSKTWLIPATKSFHHGITSTEMDSVMDDLNNGTLDDLSILGKDLAVLIFPDGTGTSTSNLRSKNPAVGDNVVLVGYGVDYADDQTPTGDGDSVLTATKREGKNTLTEDSLTYAAEENSIAIFYDRETAENASPGSYSMIASGDSGGPLFINSELAAITSSGGVSTSDAITLDIGVFVDLGSDDSRALLTTAKEGGATFNGWDSYISH